MDNTGLIMIDRKFASVTLLVVAILILVPTVYGSVYINDTTNNWSIYIQISESANSTNDTTYRILQSANEPSTYYINDTTYNIYIGYIRQNSPIEQTVAPPVVLPYCGDTTCDSNETCTSCAADCGACPDTGGGGGGGGGFGTKWCGDNVCIDNETCTNCPIDCGACVLPINKTPYTIIDITGKITGNQSFAVIVSNETVTIPYVGVPVPIYYFYLMIVGLIMIFFLVRKAKKKKKNKRIEIR